MKYVIILIAATLILSCGEAETSRHKFVIQTHEITLDTNVISTIFYKDNYYCLKENNHFVCLDKNLQVDSFITNSIQELSFDLAYFSRDTLFAAFYIKDRITKDYFLDKDFKWQPLPENHPKRPFNIPFYEDENFIVHSFCNGEFGGTIFFTDKKTKRIYSCPSTCSTVINKINNVYYLTRSLAHNDGSASVIKIEDPTKMYERNPDSLKNRSPLYPNFKTREEATVGREKYMVGTQNIMNVRKTLITTSFVYNNQLYHINTDFKKTFVSEIQHDSLFVIDTISDRSIWTYYIQNWKNGTSFNNNSQSGFITINNDTISIFTFKNNKRYK